MEGLVVGRIVYYVPHGPSVVPSPAIITRVVDDDLGTVNLQVFGDGPADMRFLRDVRPSPRLPHQPRGIVPTQEHWCWPKRS